MCRLAAFNVFITELTRITKIVSISCVFPFAFFRLAFVSLLRFLLSICWFSFANFFSCTLENFHLFEAMKCTVWAHSFLYNGSLGGHFAFVTLCRCCRQRFRWKMHSSHTLCCATSNFPFFMNKNSINSNSLRSVDSKRTGYHDKMKRQNQKAHTQSM